jgi:hypothetical protein
MQVTNPRELRCLDGPLRFVKSGKTGKIGGKSPPKDLDSHSAQGGCPSLPNFKTRAAAWRWLKTTTEDDYKLWRLNRTLDRGKDAA